MFFSSYKYKSVECIKYSVFRIHWIKHARHEIHMSTLGTFPWAHLSHWLSPADSHGVFWCMMLMWARLDGIPKTQFQLLYLQMAMALLSSEVNTTATEWTQVRERSCTIITLPEEEQYENTTGRLLCSLFEILFLPSFPNPCLLHPWVKEDAPCPQHTHNALELCNCLYNTHVNQSFLWFVEVQECTAIFQMLRKGNVTRWMSCSSFQKRPDPTPT